MAILSGAPADNKVPRAFARAPGEKSGTDSAARPAVVSGGRPPNGAGLELRRYYPPVAPFLWMMLVLKIPLLLLFWLVWWSIREVPEEATADEDDGGSRVGPDHPRPRRPRSPRRGPHSGALPAAPERTRRLWRRRAPARRRVTAPPR